MDASAPTTVAHRRALLGAAILVVLAKEVFLLADLTPNFFLGDSASYMYSALFRSVPNDRSYTYGYLIRVLALLPRSLTTLVVAQVAATAAASILLALVLLRSFGARPVVAAGAALFCSIDPTQLVLERQVLTESFTLLALALTLMAALEYIRSPRLWLLPVMQIAGVALLSLRTLYVPVMLVLALLLPIIALRGLVARAARQTARRGLTAPVLIVLHLTISVGAALATHQAYKVHTGRVSGRPPAYLYADGLFLIAAVAPILTEADAATPAIARVISSLDLENLAARTGHRWVEDGLVARIRAEVKDPDATNALCRETALNAIERNPTGFASIVMRTYVGYWDSARRRAMIRIDQGRNRRLPADVLQLLDRSFNYRPARQPTDRPPSLTQRLQMEAGDPWRYLALLSPFLAIAGLLVCRPPARSAAILVALVTAMVAAITYASATEPTTRYLHPLHWLGCLSAAVVVDGVLARRRLSVRDGS